MELSDTSSPDAAGVVHDETYFFYDCDCEFLAGGVIFKLHRLMLCRDPDSMFRGIFSVPQGTLTETVSPIKADDSAEEFRALCWALYALPTEIQMQNEQGTDLARLVAVARMGHKYTLSSFEKWALNIVWIHCQPGMDYLDTCSQDMLCEIFEAAEKGGRQDLCGLVEQRWLRRLKSGQLPLRHALDFGEMHHRRAFLGDAYYQQALDLKSLASIKDWSAAADFSQSNLTHEQLHRLLSGYCSLALAWERFRRTPVPSKQTCRSWKQRHPSSLVHVLRFDSDSVKPLDILKELKAAKEKCASDNGSGCTCMEEVLDNFISTFPLFIHDHFLGQATEYIA
ncbi:hypothetical protein B0H11DRAFT_1870390 [Mycena galericulata]|nr:hypothetical protein B0H11DRAFT_1870390 [Mycena galericulata]